MPVMTVHLLCRKDCWDSVTASITVVTLVKSFEHLTSRFIKLVVMNTLSWHNRSVESMDESPSPKRSALDTSGYSMRVQQNAETKREVPTHANEGRNYV